MQCQRAKINFTFYLIWKIDLKADLCKNTYFRKIRQYKIFAFFGMITPALFVKLHTIKIRKLSTLQFCES